MKSKIIQISVIAATKEYHDIIVALCEDGSIWNKPIDKENELNDEFEWVCISKPFISQ